MESYRRFAFSGSGATSTWTITDQDGVKYVLKTVSALGAGGTTDIATKYRWLLAQIIDPQPNHNTVTFNWSCPPDSAGNPQPQCELTSIGYTGTIVNFYWETRPDPVSYGTGTTIAKATKRLKTVKVTHGGSVQKAFALTYAQNSMSDLSRLITVKPLRQGRAVQFHGHRYRRNVSARLHLRILADVGRSLHNSRQHAGRDGARLPIDRRRQRRRKRRRCLVDPSVGYAPYGTGSTLSFVQLFARPFPTPVQPPLVLRRDQYLPGRFNSDRFLDFVFVRVVEDPSDETYTTSFVVQLSNDDGSYTKTTTKPSFFPSPPSDALYVVRDGGKGLDIASVASGEPEGGLIYPGADFDGDGIGDKMTEGRKITLSGGGSFDLESGDSGYQYRITHICLFADVNGDGLSDYIKLQHNDPMTVNVRLSRGTSLETQTAADVDGGLDGSTVADVNGDGRSDLIVGTGSGTNGVPAFVTLIGDGGTLEPQTSWSLTSLGVHAQPGGSYGTVGDFNGDGLTDVIRNRNGRYSTAPGTVDNLMVKAFNNYGAEVDIAYQPSSVAELLASSTSYKERLPAIEQTVKSITVKDGRLAAAVSRFSYGNALYDYANRRFLGFGHESEFLPCINGEPATDCPSVARYLNQDLAAVGALLGQTHFVGSTPGAASITSELTRTYTSNNTTAPFTALPTDLTDFHYKAPGTIGTPNYIATRHYLQYNAYGNLIRDQDYGRSDVTGDEKVSYTFFNANTSAFITDKPASEVVYSGLLSSDPGSVLQKRITYFYDTNTSSMYASADRQRRAAGRAEDGLPHNRGDRDIRL